MTDNESTETGAVDASGWVDLSAPGNRIRPYVLSGERSIGGRLTDWANQTYFIQWLFPDVSPFTPMRKWSDFIASNKSYSVASTMAHSFNFSIGFIGYVEELKCLL